MADKKWNAEKGVWEIDGTPVTYRVTWTSDDPGGEQHTREFSDVDQGYSFYEDTKKSANAYSVTWEHVPW